MSSAGLAQNCISAKNHKDVWVKRKKTALELYKHLFKNYIVKITKIQDQTQVQQCVHISTDINETEAINTSRTCDP